MIAGAGIRIQQRRDGLPGGEGVDAGSQSRVRSREHERVYQSPEVQARTAHDEDRNLALRQIVEYRPACLLELGDAVGIGRVGKIDQVMRNPGPL